MIIFLYVDDCGISSPDMSEIDAFIDRLKAKGFKLTKECDFSAYLGIKFHRNLKNNNIIMAQHELIKKVIEATGWNSALPTRLPLHRLHLDQILKDLQSRKPGNIHLWLNVSLFIYQQKTRYCLCSHPSSLVQLQSKAVSASAVTMIIRYLSATSDKGIIFTPTTDFKVDCYVDTDFSGLHGREAQDLSASVCSRTGYIMFIYSCPLIWKSQLQTETALRIFHAEYVALSSAI